MNNPTNEQFKKKFDFIASRYDKVSNLYSVSRRFEFVIRNVDGLTLEVGSGTALASEKIKNLVCTDISFNMCKMAKKRNPEVVCCDAEMLPFRDNIFCTIISAEMIYYLRNPQNFILCSKRILKGGGNLLISMANKDTKFVDKIRSILRKIGISNTYFDDGLIEFMALEHLINLLTSHGFIIDSIEKRVLIPFFLFDKINQILEATILNRFAILIFIKATRK